MVQSPTNLCNPLYEHVIDAINYLPMIYCIYVSLFLSYGVLQYLLNLNGRMEFHVVMVLSYDAHHMISVCGSHRWVSSVLRTILSEDGSDINIIPCIVIDAYGMKGGSIILRLWLGFILMIF